MTFTTANNSVATGATTIDQQLIIFDLDQTLSKRDTYLAFLIFALKRRPKRLVYLPILFASTVLFKLGLKSNHWLKAVFLSAILGNESIENVNKWAHDFNSKLIANGMYKEALKTLYAHIKSKDTIILASASLDIYLEDLAKKLGITRLICTKAEVKNNLVTGKLDGKNCHGKEKLIRVKNYLAKHNLNGPITVYSDHPSDFPLLNYADKAMLINPDDQTKKAAEKYNFTLTYWK